MAHDLRFAALFSDWRLELMSTNWLGYWIIQLTSENHKPLAMLINLDHLTAICTSMRLCIDTANNPSQYPGATTMLQRVAVDLPTQDNTDGAITILSDWRTGSLCRSVSRARITGLAARRKPQAIFRALRRNIRGRRNFP